MGFFSYSQPLIYFQPFGDYYGVRGNFADSPRKPQLKENIVFIWCRVSDLDAINLVDFIIVGLVKYTDAIMIAKNKGSFIHIL